MTGCLLSMTGRKISARRTISSSIGTGTSQSIRMSSRISLFRGSIYELRNDGDEFFYERQARLLQLTEFAGRCVDIGRSGYGHHCLRIAALAQDERAELHRNGLAGSHHSGAGSCAHSIGVGALRTWRADSMAHSSARSDTFYHLGDRLGADLVRTCKGNPSRRHRLDAAGRKALAWRNR